MSGKIRVGLVEDHALFRQGIKLILASWENIEIVFESADGYSVIDRLKGIAILPNVMLVDLFLPRHDKIEFNGLEVTAALQKHYPEIKVIILSGHQDESFIAHLIESGAHGYLVKDCDPQEVYDAVCSAHARGSYINERSLLALQKRSRAKPQATMVDTLSKREIEVLDLICKQLTSEEIAEKLFISIKTVNGHRINLLEKTGTKNTAGLVLYAVKKGIIQL